MMPPIMTERRYKVGDRITVKLSGGRSEEAVVKAVVEKTDGVRYQVSFQNETALIYSWQVVGK
jgi:uncharacterized protein Veg